MRRREFIKLLGGASAAWPLAARAQRVSKVYRVGVLMPFAQGDPEGERRVTAFEEGLQEFGWAVGQNVHIDLRWVGTDPEHIQLEALSR